MKIAQRIPQIILGIALAYAGIGHLTTNRTEFQAQVPTILKSWADFVVLASGVVEIVLGLCLIFLWRYRVAVGWVVAAVKADLAKKLEENGFPHAAEYVRKN